MSNKPNKVNEKSAEFLKNIVMQFTSSTALTAAAVAKALGIARPNDVSKRFQTLSNWGLARNEDEFWHLTRPIEEVLAVIDEKTILTSGLSQKPRNVKAREDRRMKNELKQVILQKGEANAQDLAALNLAYKHPLVKRLIDDGVLEWCGYRSDFPVLIFKPDMRMERIINALILGLSAEAEAPAM